jgi:hypothetical protein
MLTYHPLYDPFHCIYRLLLLSKYIKDNCSIQRIRIADYFLLFPHQLKDITFPKKFIKLKKYINNIPMQYEVINSKIRIFAELTNIQDMALNILVSKNIIDYDNFNQDIFNLTPNFLKNMQHLSPSTPTDKIEWVSILIEFLTVYELNGPDGIKNRTGLGEYRYDKIS